MARFWDLIPKKKEDIEDGLGAVALVIMLTVFTTIYTLLSY